MLNMKDGHFASPQLPLSISALLIIMGQLFFIFKIDTPKSWLTKPEIKELKE
ncbi:hypothetical protein Lnau_0684 [Legionella nautarum]|uniref:Uncharacterized protein n=1 Tax=Legionella nautarum TaxID=45070 RepID=A0A0W0WTS6_9GAMM|nr:hypothetical protein [Legionella nautarum]KTD35700.1 hypothetical protein Lnau_0684 [Legionella nautarum]